MKKLLFVSLILIVGLLTYVIYFARDITPSSETFSSVIMPPLVIYLFFGVLLFMIVRKGYDFMVSR
jgi:ABC-type Na+ efflux pump permease subunit